MNTYMHIRSSCTLIYLLIFKFCNIVENTFLCVINIATQIYKDIWQLVFLLFVVAVLLLLYLSYVLKILTAMGYQPSHLHQDQLVSSYIAQSRVPEHVLHIKRAKQTQVRIVI